MSTYDEYTKAVLHFNGANASTTFTDEIGHTFTVTGDPVISTAQSALGGASGLFNGTGYLTSTSNDFQLSSGAWCIEFRLRLTDTNTRTLFVSKGSTTDYDRIQRDGTDQKFTLLHRENSTNTYRHLYTALSLNTWYAIAIVKDSSGIRLYKNGALVDSDTAMTMFEYSTLDIGRGYDGTNAFSGYLDELRISKGDARYVADYTVSTEEFGTTTPEPEFPVASVQYKINPSIWMPNKYVSENDEFTVSDTIIGGVEITNLDCHLYLGSTEDLFRMDSTQTYSSNKYTTGKISGLKGNNVYVLSCRVTIDGQIKTRKCEIHVQKESVI